MLAAPDILAKAMSLPPSSLEKDCPGRVCAISGTTLERGAPVQKVASSATPEFLETFRGDLHGFVSPGAAALFAAANPRAKSTFSVRPGKEPEQVSVCTTRGYLAFADGSLYMPMVSQESADAKGWPSWRDAVQEVWPERANERCVVLITDDFKKRLWPYSKAGPLGTSTPVFVHETSLYSLSTVLTIDWPAMLRQLHKVEELYSLGFSKPSIKDNLLSSKAGVEAVGLVEAIRLESKLSHVRESDEFRVALVIAQKLEMPCPSKPKSKQDSTTSSEKPAASSRSVLDTGSCSQLSLL